MPKTNIAHCSQNDNSAQVADVEYEGNTIKIGVTCACCGKRERDMRFLDGKILCVQCAGRTVEDPHGGPRVCWKCREPVDHRSSELVCESCLWTERGAQ